MNELIKLQGEGFEILATPEAEELKLSLLNKADTICIVDSKETESAARSVLTDLAGFRKALEATRKAVKEPVLQLGRKIDSIAEQFGSAVATQEHRIKSIIGAYAMIVERERQRLEAEAEAARLEAIKREREAEAARIKAEQTKTSLAEAKVERLEIKADQAKAASFQAALQAEEIKVKGASMVWDFEVTDIHALYEYDQGCVSMEPKRREVLELIKFCESRKIDPATIPGIRAFKKPSVRA